MANRRLSADTVVRVNFQVALSVNPLLASDLKRFTLGRSRHARLLTLAMIGLMTETKKLNGESSISGMVEVGNGEAPASSAPRLNDHDFLQIGEL